jgi:hypothetical protein
MAMEVQSPEWDLPDRMAERNSMAVERTWKLPGAFATWTVTLTTTPADGALEPFDDDWPLDALDRFGEHFLDTANLLEYQRLLEERSRRGTIVG